MDREVSIVLSVERRDYRKVAQKWYGLTDEQMEGMDVHHNPARHEGGRNIPEHLYVYHNALHSAVHDNNFISWARKGAAAAHEAKDHRGKSLTALRSHQKKDEEGRSLLAVQNGRKASQTLHAAKDERGRSLHGVRSAQRLNAEKDSLGRSVQGVKNAERLHREKDEQGRSLAGVSAGLRLHAKKNDSGKSDLAVKGGRNAAKKLHAEKDELGRSVVAMRVNNQRWRDPDHPELGERSAGTLVQMQKAREYPHNKENRVRVV